MSAETPGIASDKNRDTKTPPTRPSTTIPPLEKGGLGGLGGIRGIHHLDIWTSAATEKKSGRGRSGGNGISVYGIQKLRELILELAVRGQLVPQDPNDEPASELLKRIQAEKARLVAQGKIKKDKPLPPISDEEKLFELPQRWEWVRLGEICSYIQRGKGPSYVEKSDFSVISQKCVRWTGLDLSQARFIDPESLIKYEEIRKLCEGDILWNSTGTGTIGRACYVPSLEKNKILFADSHVTVVRPIAFSTIFLWRWIQSPSVQFNIEGVASGTTNQIELNTSTVISQLLPLPPLYEQHRIVAKVDELMALCDQLEMQHNNAAEAHEQLVNHLLGTLTQSHSADDFSDNWQRIAAHFESLFITETSIDALKQTLLQLAVMGKLVPQDPNDEPASELLKRIQAEKARLIAEGKIKKGKSPLPPLLPRGETGSVAATSINPTTTTLSNPPLSNSTLNPIPNPNPNPNPPFEKGGPGGIQRGISEEEKPFELPQGWEWISLEEISQVGTGATPLRTKLKYFNPAIISWVTSGETSSPYIFETKQCVSLLALKQTNLTLYPKGTLIVAMYGQGKTRGQITELMIEATTNQACAAIRLIDSDEFHRKYVKLFFEKTYDEIRELAAGGAQPNLNLSKVKETVLPLPPLPEQHRIVAKVDELMTLCDQLKSTITQARGLKQKLADVIVEQAVSS